MHIREMSKEDVLRVYDPTLDMDAQPSYIDDTDLEPVPDEWEIDRVQANDDTVITSSTFDIGDERVTQKVTPKDLRVAVDGRLIRGAFDASKSGGWVRFLAMRPPENRTWSTEQEKWIDVHPYSHVGPDGQRSGLGAVTGIVFGHVEWFVKKGVVRSSTIGA